MYLKLVIRIIVLSSIVLALHVSCNKESHIELTTDSIAIAKIYQPNSITGRDAVVQSFLPDSNYSNLDYLLASAWTNAGKFNASRALIEFDFSDIPVQTKIDSATLSLFWTSSGIFTGQKGENAFSIYKITGIWWEGFISWNSKPAISNENFVKVPKSTSEQQSYLDINVTNLVQDMVNNPSENHGFMLKLDEESPYKLVIVASSNHPDESRHPKLVVYY